MHHTYRIILSAIIFFILLLQAHTGACQSYRVEIDLVGTAGSNCQSAAQGMGIYLGGEIQYTTSINELPANVFNRVFTTKPYISEMQVMPTLTCEYMFGGIALCNMADVNLLNPEEVNMGPGGECNSQSLQAITACGLISGSETTTIQLYFSVKWTPIYTITTPPAQTNYCENELVGLTATSGYPAYTWEFSDDFGVWKTFADPPNFATSSSIAVNLNNLYGTGDNSSRFNQPIIFGLRIGACERVTTTPVRFFAVAPLMEDDVPSDPACHGGTGSFTINTFNRETRPGELFKVTVQDIADIGNLGVASGITTASLPVTISNLSPGTFNIVIETTVNGQTSSCGIQSVAGSFTIDEPEPVTFDDTGTILPSCHVNTTGVKNNGGIQIVAEGGQETGFAYSVDSQPFQPMGGSTYTITGLTAGTHSVKVRDLNQCESGVQNIEILSREDITFPSPVITQYNGRDLRCAGGSDGEVTVSGVAGGTGSFQYSRDGTNFQTANVFSGLSANSYTFTIRDANNCRKTSTALTLIAPPVVIGNVITTPATCFGDSDGTITVAASGGTGTLLYSLNGVLPFRTDNEFTGQGAGTHTITIKDMNDCSINIPATITQPLEVGVAGSASVVSCSGGSDGVVTLSATHGTAPYTYSFNGSAYGSGNTFTNVSASSYSISAKDSKGCIGNGNILVTSHAALTGILSVQTAISCNGSSNGALNLTPGGGVGPYTYSWSNSSTSEDIQGLTSGTYTVTITDSKSCSKAFSQTLSQPDPIAIHHTASDYEGFNIKCFGQNNGSINITATGGNGGYSYSWSNSSTSEDPSNLSAGNYTVHVLDSKNCTGTKSITLTQPPQLVSTQMVQNILCFGTSTGSIHFNATGGTGADTYEYSINNGTDWKTTPDFLNLPTGTYTLLTRDASHCQATGSQTLSSPAEIVLTLSNLVNTTCNQSNGSATITATGGVAAYQYEWRTGSHASIGTTAAISNLSAGTYTITVTDQNGCSKQQTVPISSSNGPQVTTQAIIPARCHSSQDGSATITVTGGTTPYTIRWPDNQATATASNLAGGTYLVEVKDNTNCLALQSITIPAPAELQINTLLKQDPNCAGHSDGAISIEATGGNDTDPYSYSWNTGQTTPSLTNLPAGSYTIEVKDIRDCTAEKQIVLLDPPPFSVNLGPDQKICEGMNVTLHAAEDNATYMWSSTTGFSSTNQTVQLTEAGTYTLTVISAKGCEASDSFGLFYDSNLLKADFLMSSEAHAGDTVMLIDISWPLPDQTTWSYDPGAVIIEETQDYAMIRYDETGEYTVSLLARLAECVNKREGQLTIVAGEEQEDPEDDAQRLITGASAYPNPSPEAVSVSVDLSESREVILEVYQMMSGKRVHREGLEAGRAHLKAINLSMLPAGMYVLRIRAGREIREIKIVKQ